MKYLFWLTVVLLIVFDVQSTELTVKVIDTQAQAVSNMVVYARPSNGIKNLPTNTKALVIDQQNKKFSPYVTVMQKGQAISFVNKDDITHHIYSVSGKNRFEFKVKAGEKVKTQSMLVSEEIAMGCNIHDWMSGYTLVVDTPYYGKTDSLGQYTLILPHSGEYVITAWHPQLDVMHNNIVQTITIDNSFASHNGKMNMMMTLPTNLLPLPEQTGQDEFDFIEEY